MPKPTLQEKEAPPPPAIDRGSHAIAKEKPAEVRVVLVLTPKVVKIDPADFREIVQQLTGKHNESTKAGGCHHEGREMSGSVSTPGSATTNIPIDRHQSAGSGGCAEEEEHGRLHVETGNFDRRESGRLLAEAGNVDQGLLPSASFRF